MWIKIELTNEMWKKPECLRGIQPMTTQTLDELSIQWATRPHEEQGHLLSSYVTGVLHTATITTVGFIVSVVSE